MDPVQNNNMGGEQGQQPPMSQDQMRSNLKEVMALVDQKRQEFLAKQTQGAATGAPEMSSGSTSTIPPETGDMATDMKNMFDFLSSQGVDPKDVESVKQYMMSLQQSDPQLFQTINERMQKLFSGAATMPEEQASPLASETQNNNMNMNPNESIRKII
jgi:hypothetical protein